jgi:hypothetical protein
MFEFSWSENPLPAPDCQFDAFFVLKEPQGIAKMPYYITVYPIASISAGRGGDPLGSQGSTYV